MITSHFTGEANAICRFIDETKQAYKTVEIISIVYCYGNLSGKIYTVFYSIGGKK